MAEAYFAKLTGAPYKRFVELGEGTHTVMLEKNRMQFFHEILGFLDELDTMAAEVAWFDRARADKLSSTRGAPRLAPLEGIRSHNLAVV